MFNARLWHLWPGTYVPAMKDEEKSFATYLESVVPAELRTHPPGELRFDRGDVTAVLNALRCGVQANELIELIPGTAPERLWWAYRHLFDLCERGHDEFMALLKYGASAVNVNISIAGTYAPIPTAKMCAALPLHNTQSVSEEVASILEATSQSCAKVEAQLRQAQLLDVAPRAVAALGRSLYDPYNPCLWGHPYFLPRRVGELTPTRVRDLLNERSC